MTSRAVLAGVGRVLLSAMFVVGGVQALREPASREKMAERAGVPRPALAVRVNGCAMTVAGAGLALGVRKRTCAGVLAGTIVPTTLAGHQFWKEPSAIRRELQLHHFLKNAGLFGGTLLVMADRH